MAIVEFHFQIRRFLPIAALVCLLPISAVDAQIKLSPGRVPIGDNELNSPIAEPQVTIDEHTSNAVMRPVPLAIQQAKDPLVKLAYETREAQRRRLLSTAEHTPWQIMHGMLALREEFLIRHNGKPVSCLEWIKSGPTFENESWFEKTQVRVLNGRGGNNAWELMMVGRGHPYNKPYAFEGHINQFVAILSMSGVPLETQFNTPQGPVSMRDMLTYAKMTVNEKEEVTWTLWALSRYLPPDAEWTNAQGQKWSIERLVKIETAKSLQGAPCGGTHGLFALAHARNVYLRTGKPLVGVWLEAEQKIRRYIQTARMQQNSNGTLSSNYFRGREYKQDFDKRMASSGHLLEFLMMALPSQELNAPWVRRAIEATSNDLMVNRKTEVSCSPLYHATSALSIYMDRVNAVAPNIAQGAPKTHTIANNKEIKTADASLTRPAVEPQVAVPTEEVNSEAVKTPVMESAGVDSNGAPKALTGPTTTVPDLPEKPESGAPPAPSEQTPANKPADVATPAEPVPTEPVPTEPVPTEPVPAEPVPAEPVPAEPVPAEPVPAEPVPTEPVPTEPVPTEPVPTEPVPAEPVPAEPVPAEPVPTGPVPTGPVPTEPVPAVAAPTEPDPLNTAEIPAIPSRPTATASAGLPAVAPTQSSAVPVAVPITATDKIREFGPSAAPEAHIAARSNRPGDKTVVQEQRAIAAESLSPNSLPEATVVPERQIAKPSMNLQVPSAPVPPVPLPSELLIGLPENQPVPTPVDELSSEQPALVIPAPAVVVPTEVPVKPNESKSQSYPLKSLTIPLRSVSDSRVLPDDKNHPPAELPKEKKQERWKATPPERRKVIVVEEKKPGV